MLKGGYKVVVTGDSSLSEILRTAMPGTAMHRVYYETMDGNPASFKAEFRALKH